MKFTILLVVTSDYLTGMDDKWFKRQQKIAGVTAEDIGVALGRDRSVVSRIFVGRQKMSLDQASIFAEVLNVPLQTVLEKAGIAPQSLGSAPNLVAAEGDVSLLDLNASEQIKNDMISRAFGNAGPSMDVWTVTSNALQFLGYVVGDRILVDTNLADTAKSGDVVIARMYDRRNTAERTILRRYEAPILITATAEAIIPAAVIADGNSVVIKGKVIASWRT
ncbi:hypothetical protein [Roseobacter sp. N2S]|uniref:helix-turn-helix domain-containing protein n=1 Tax=Roseobacter sp. N2S TaxID=2663844 RepID=UPI002865A5AA|nr:hypothetical protein [Roseobacter sp. N2S]MDR6266561.1 hypothetical protein [Roseobacter sp. N2S]